ncbi:hypothetical protein GCM10011571_07000 [Marinithermofilum abyssi]|uniref:Uncharacterized protein n=1 Tax=Marinithermofilum abyssi TaxID=1571185 RepID=A0A8J2VDD7_9BACL|nr:hypothetical protein GCM10011571_07000 [Marinithermofilum abyssi]
MTATADHEGLVGYPSLASNLIPLTGARYLDLDLELAELELGYRTEDNNSTNMVAVHNTNMDIRTLFTPLKTWSFIMFKPRSFCDTTSLRYVRLKAQVFVDGKVIRNELPKGFFTHCTEMCVKESVGV